MVAATFRLSRPTWSLPGPTSVGCVLGSASYVLSHTLHICRCVLVGSRATCGAQLMFPCPTPPLHCIDQTSCSSSLLLHVTCMLCTQTAPTDYSRHSRAFSFLLPSHPSMVIHYHKFKLSVLVTDHSSCCHCPLLLPPPPCSLLRGWSVP